MSGAAFKTSLGSEWREGPLIELVATRGQGGAIPGFDGAQCEAILAYICDA